MTIPASANRISEVNFEEGFTGSGKVFIEVQKQADNSEKLVIYEANNVFTAFFLNYFRNPSKTFTAREWAANLQAATPEKIDKDKLIQNIKQAASKNCIESAPQILNKLVADKKLDAPEAEVSKFINDLPLGAAAFATELQTKFEKLSDNFGKTKTSATGKQYFPKDKLSMAITIGSPLHGTFETNRQVGRKVINELANDMPVTGLKDHPRIKEIVTLLGKNAELSGKHDAAIEELKFLTQLLLAQEESPVSATNTRYVVSLKLVIACLEDEISTRKQKQVQT